MCLLAFIFQVSSFQDQSSTWNTACSSKWRRQHVWLHTLACLLREMVRIPEALREVQIFSKSQRKTYTFRRRQRAADRQDSALPKHTAAWFAPMRQNNQDWRVSYCFLALLLLFCKGLMDWNWCMPIQKSERSKILSFLDSYWREMKLSRFRDLTPLSSLLLSVRAIWFNLI